MFNGHYEHTLDSKGRLVLPSAFREPLKDGLVLTMGYDHGIDVWTPESYETRVEALRRLPREDARNRALRLFVTSSAFPQTPDSQHRIVVPQGLRDYAGLKRDLTIVGDDDKVMIFDREAWAAYQRHLLTQIPNIDGVLTPPS